MDAIKPIGRVVACFSVAGLFSLMVWLKASAMARANTMV